MQMVALTESVSHRGASIKEITSPGGLVNNFTKKLTCDKNGVFEVLDLNE